MGNSRSASSLRWRHVARHLTGLRTPSPFRSRSNSGRQSVPCSSRCPVSELEATGSKRLEILDELSALVGAQVGAVLVALMAGIGVAGNRFVTCHGKGHKPARMAKSA